MGCILSIIAYVLFLILAVLNFVAVIVTYAKKQGFLKTINNYWFTNALDLDRFANYHFRTLLRVTLKRKKGYQFGNQNETISFVLGKNQIDRTLTVTGWIIVYLLYVIDYKNWKNGGHCIATVKN